MENFMQEYHDKHMGTVRGSEYDPKPCEATEMQEPSPEHKEFVRGLRELADFYEARPDLQLPFTRDMCVYPDSHSKEDVFSFSKLLGKAKKYYSDTFFSLDRAFGNLRLRVMWYREQVCEWVVVGTETVEEDVVVSQTTEKRTVTRDKVEWKCPPLASPRLEE